MVIYSGHDTNLKTIFSNLMSIEKIYALNGHLPPFASTLFIELWEVDGEYEVRLIFNDQEIFLSGCKKKRCSVDQFRDLLKSRISDESPSDFCGVTKKHHLPHDIDLSESLTSSKLDRKRLSRRLSA
eukprot:TRINITY_DN6281_c0_g1_i2.p1 TRINITY_DN6281_c0_g1~~TRINITY_DN6281_c0_g1_i2.p1  ORF type:complete len:127 (-),score=24.66 TRINITY_DN6281_c0_g1_i2:120-500(-)